jgi:hypothetical protein
LGFGGVGFAGAGFSLGVAVNVMGRFIFKDQNKVSQRE